MINDAYTSQNCFFNQDDHDGRSALPQDDFSTSSKLKQSLFKMIAQKLMKYYMKHEKN